VLRRTGNTAFITRSGAAVAALLLFLAALMSIPTSRANAQAGDPDAPLEGSGIRYPGGFDADTVGEIRGRASGLLVPESGPVRFRLDTGKDRYTVLASPPWYWKDLRVALPDGSEVRVRGSITLGKDMNLYVVAQEIRLHPSGDSFVMRDEDGFPRWKSRRGAGTGNGAGGGSPMRRGGGGGGPGGMGGRRR
jgi:uncharacterized membrane protein YgcG